MAIIGDFTKKGSKTARRTALVVFILLVVGGLALYYFYDIRYNYNSSELSTTKLNIETNSYVFKKNYSAAINLINKQPRNKRDTEAEQQLLASIYLNEGNYHDALNVYENLIDSYGDSVALAVPAAEAALGEKNYTESAYYYNQAATLEKNDHSDPLASENSSIYSQDAQQVQQEHSL